MTAGRCSTCYRETEVRTTDLYEWPLCALCESRMRNGLVHVSFSNGTEFDCFHSQCFKCRHYIDDPNNLLPGRMEAPYNCCAWGVLDRMMIGMCESFDHGCFWHDPESVQVTRDGRPLCPPVCLRFTPNDYDHDDRDPPPPDVPGQMVFADASVPVERVPQREEARR